MENAVAITDAAGARYSDGLAIRKWLVLGAVLFLPFTYALTVNLMFPLKVYEVLLLFAAVSYLFDLRVPTAPTLARTVRPLIALLIAASLLLLIRLTWPISTLEVGAYHTRFGPTGDGLTEIVYLCLSVFGLFVFSYCAYQYERQFLQCWTIGALAACAYTWYLFILSAAGHQPFLLPGIERLQYAHIGSLTVIRSGTFREGNFLGLYLVLSAAVALYGRFTLRAAIMSLTVFLTFSTVNTIALGILWLGIAWRHLAIRRGMTRRFLYVIAASIVFGGVVATLIGTGYAQRVLVGKLSTTSLGSKLDRIDLAVAGLRMLAAHPVAGVGISQYGYHYRAYQLTSLMDQFRTAKPIANNVYVELLSELGLIGFFLFGLFLWRVYHATRGVVLIPLRWGVLAMLVVFNAFPAYNIMFLWAFFGLILAADSRRQLQPGPEEALLPA